MKTLLFLLMAVAAEGQTKPDVLPPITHSIPDVKCPKGYEPDWSMYRQPCPQGMMCHDEANCYLVKKSPPKSKAVNLVTMISAGCVNSDTKQAVTCPEDLHADSPKPEPMDVAAIEVGAHLGCESTTTVCIDRVIKDYSCADKHRILLTDEGGGKHCILFPKDSR